VVDEERRAVRVGRKAVCEEGRRGGRRWKDFEGEADEESGGAGADQNAQCGQRVQLESRGCDGSAGLRKTEQLQRAPQRPPNRGGSESAKWAGPGWALGLATALASSQQQRQGSSAALLGHGSPDPLVVGSSLCCRRSGGDVCAVIVLHAGTLALHCPRATCMHEQPTLGTLELPCAEYRWRGCGRQVRRASRGAVF